LVRQGVKGVYLCHRNIVISIWTKFRALAPAALVAAALTATGCKQQKVTSYEIPKEDYSIKAFEMPKMASASRPEIKFDAPKDWRETSAQMGAGAFHVEGEEGKYADIKVIPLRAGPEIEAQSVNMWRENLGLPGLPPDQVKGEPITVGGVPAHFYDFKSEEPKFGGKFKSRTTAAVIEKDETLWFVKMDGEESVVTAQQDAFKDFLKSIRFEEAQAPATQVAGGAPWKAPEGWTQKTAGQMVLAAYQANKNGKTADITVTSFPGDVGGVLANVNRWRGQVGLPPIDAGSLGKETKTVELAGGEKATVVDVTGQKRLYGLMVPREGKTWFYKMIGDPGVVGAEAQKLVEFAGTAH
jgi:hypothetical protein